MKKVKLFFAAALVGMTIMGTGSAMASYVNCKMTKVDTAPVTSNTYIYCIAPSYATPSTTIYYCSTKDVNLVSAASAAAVNHTTIRMWTGSTFPTTGSWRSGGTCTWIEIYTNL